MNSKWRFIPILLYGQLSRNMLLVQLISNRAIGSRTNPAFTPRWLPTRSGPWADHLWPVANLNIPRYVLVQQIANCSSENHDTRFHPIVMGFLSAALCYPDFPTYDSIGLKSILTAWRLQDILKDTWNCTICRLEVAHDKIYRSIVAHY